MLKKRFEVKIYDTGATFGDTEMPSCFRNEATGEIPSLTTDYSYGVWDNHLERWIQIGNGFILSSQTIEDMEKLAKVLNEIKD